MPDNLNSAVTKVDNHGPVVDRVLLYMENHVGTVILPTHSAKPRDKAILERVVRVVYSRIFAPLRNMSFHNLEQLKQEMAWQLEQYNAQPFQIGHQCCHMSCNTLYFNSQKLFSRLKMMKTDGSYNREIGKIDQYDILILDDLGLHSLNAPPNGINGDHWERAGKKSTIFITQLPVAK